ncbi:hypothetical protein [Microvirga mediterraneensis]|uniref:Uncharacterized protein n=1 Tax=Microvirga mediterraneensis TaxID=2754695 RepID=A0A838BXQ7_9HYPH|nr:hypothetical protein [Microvirga mediterraneensis]MBA1159356.1 hypothetical protein [Microvirga mediterraneensis]
MRQTIDHRADRVPIDDQCAEMLSIITETEFDLQRRTASGQITPMQATDRRRRRHAILATLKWIQENRETVIEAHKMLRPAPEEMPDLDDVYHDESLTPDEE